MFFLIILNLILGLILRLIAINQSLWLDEAISVQAATNYSFSGLLGQFMPADFHPPLYYLILYFWLKIFPQTEFFIRLPSVIFGVLTSLFIYKIYLYIFKEKRGALFSLILLLTSPLHIYYSQEARMYSLATLFTTGSIYYFLKLLNEKKRLFIIHYSLFIILMLYSHYLCWLILISQWLYFFISQKWKNKRLFLNFSISQFLNFFFYLPWLPVFFNQFKIGKRVGEEAFLWRQLLGKLSFGAISLLPIKFIIGRTSFTNKYFYFLIALLLVSFFAFLLCQTLKEKKKDKFVKLIWFWLVIPPILGIIISFKIPVFSYFRFLFCLPAFYLLIARGILSFKKWQKITILVLIINIFFSFRYLLNQNFHRENWQQAVAALHQKNIGKAPVLILENVTAPFSYYDKKVSNLTYFSQKELVAHEDVVWLIPYAQPIFDSQDLTRKFLQAKGFQRAYEEHFRGITLEKWQKLVAVKQNRV